MDKIHSRSEGKEKMRRNHIRIQKPKKNERNSHTRINREGAGNNTSFGAYSHSVGLLAVPLTCY